MMEAATISMGATQDDLLGHLAEIANIMKPALTDAQRYRVADTVLGMLDNRGNCCACAVGQ